MTAGWAETLRVGSAAEGLRKQAWAELEAAGLRFDEARQQCYLLKCHAAAEPLATEIRKKLELRSPPQSNFDHAFLASVDTMTTFACAATDVACEILAREPTVDEVVQRSVSVFVLGSALLDHFCDEDRALLGALTDRVTVSWTAAALSGQEPGDPIANYSGPALLEYMGVLLAEAARLWTRVAWTEPALHRAIERHTLISNLAGALSAELQTTVSDAVRTERDTATIWSTPFLLAAGLVSLSARTETSYRDALPELHAIGRLIAMIDDIVDIQADARSGAANELLRRARDLPHAATVPGQGDPLLRADVVTQYMRDLGHSARRLSSVAYGDRLAAWLFYWLAS
jgi:hypothetical protein